jgi:hypothetical protein
MEGEEGEDEGEDGDEEAEAAASGEEEDDEDNESSSEESFGEIDLGDDDEDEEIDLELRNKIEEALRVHGIKPATEEDDEEEDEELMDDDQMMAIDAQLAQVFQARANEKKGSKSMSPRFHTHFMSTYLLYRCERSARSHAFQEPRPRLGGHFPEEAANKRFDSSVHRPISRGDCRVWPRRNATSGQS